ncbi:MAG: tyrosine-type recombinase/integrase [Chloroflexales bacterium]|nr:tyrosine-type recombinase/integrase [Chloroflexales bacterium]
MIPPDPPTTITPLQPSAPRDPATRRELAVAAWLAEKAGLSASRETQRSYAATLLRFRQTLAGAGLDLDSEHQQVKLAAQAFAAHGRVKAVTHNKRLSVLSSFYTYSIEAGLLDPPNPIDAVKRRRVQPYRASKALDIDAVRRKLAAIDRATLAGARDYALLGVGLLTGRRVSELAGLRWADVHQAEGGLVRLIWQRTKGDETMIDRLPRNLSAALMGYLQRVYGAALADVPHSVAVWVSISPHNYGGPISAQAVADICQRHLGTSRVHQLRHTFARTMEQQGAKLSDIQQRLGHKNIATTSLYLQALGREDNPFAEEIEHLLGLEQ